MNILRLLICLSLFLPISALAQTSYYVNRNCTTGTTYNPNAGDDTAACSGGGEQVYSSLNELNSVPIGSNTSIYLANGQVFDTATLNLNISSPISNLTITRHGSWSTVKPLIDGDTNRPIVIDETSLVTNLLISGLDISGMEWLNTGQKSTNLSLGNIQNVTVEYMYMDGRGGSRPGHDVDLRCNTALYMGAGDVGGNIIVRFNEIVNLFPYDSTTPVNENEPGAQNNDCNGIGGSRKSTGDVIEFHDNTINNVNGDCIGMHGYLEESTSRVYNNDLGNAGEQLIDIKHSDNVEVFNNNFWFDEGLQNMSDAAQAAIICNGADTPGHEPEGDAENCDIHNNVFSGRPLLEGCRITTGGLGTNAGTVNFRAYDNHFRDCDCGINLGRRARQSQIYNNIFENCGDANTQSAINLVGTDHVDTQIYNNTIWSDEATVLEGISGNDIGTIRIENNIIHLASPTAEQMSLSNNVSPINQNCYYGPNAIQARRNNVLYDISTAGGLATWNGLTGVSGDLNDDPLFANPPSDFRILQSSPCQSGGTPWGALSEFYAAPPIPVGAIDQVEGQTITVAALPPQPPSQAINPVPTDGAIDQAIDVDVSWEDGGGAASYDVYFGTVQGNPTFIGNQAGTTYDPGILANLTQYFWRIDSVNNDGTTTGVEWDFTTIIVLADQATNPSPADGAIDQAVDVDLSWTAGARAASHDVYFGTTQGSPAFQGNQPSPTFDPGALANSTQYFWRIDEVNAAGTTTGVEWDFTTIAAGPPPLINGIDVETVTLADGTVLVVFLKTINNTNNYKFGYTP